MSRRLARETALQVLFQLDFNDAAGDYADSVVLALETAAGEHEELTGEAKAYAERLVRGVREHLEELDAKISQAAKRWRLSRMAAVERNILRLAAYEMLYEEGITPGIAINEAVEIAKIYGEDRGASFVNGILGALVPKS